MEAVYTDTGTRTPSVREIPLFICYRRQDGAWHADWLYQQLKDATFLDASSNQCHVRVYYDKTAPGVSDWKNLHFPSLQTSRAMILICTPGMATDFSKRGQPDWVYEELRWWCGHRDTAPIVVDATGEGERWLPRLVTRKWPNVNRIDLDRDDATAHGAETDFALRISERIIGAIRESEQRTVFEDLQTLQADDQ
jgi:TIR domain